MSLEWVLFLATLALGAIVFIRKSLLAAFLACAVVVVVAAVWSSRQQQREQRLAEVSRVVPRQGRPGGFVTSDTCQSCHPQQYATWHQSYHRTMTQYPTPETVRGNFDHTTLELAGETYRFERRNDGFWVEMTDPDWKRRQSMANPALRPDTPAQRVWRRIGLVTGSHHMQTYWVPSAEGNMQLSVPFTYLFEDERWVPRNATFLMDPANPVAVQLWNANCIQCHVTAGQPRPEAGNWFLNDTRMAEVGIACEACHGPAEQHVRANRNPLHRYAQYGNGPAAKLIVNPAGLDHKASAQVCGQCHGIKAIPPGHPWRYEGFKYRPGDDLEGEIPILRAVHHSNEWWFKDLLRREPTFIADRYWPDGMVRVSGREYNGLLETPCFQKGTMSCLSCHSLHQGNPDDQLAARMDSNQACLQCHADIREQEHSRHKAGSSGNSCYNCHMPHTTYGLMKAIRSHTIDSPDVEASIRTGRPNACNLCHLDKTLAWTAKYLGEWYGRKEPALSPDEQRIPATVLMTLRGDAGQRALMAWHMGWEPARQASGEKWLPPYLAQLLEDPYATVRHIADRSLRQLPEYRDFTYDFIAAEPDRAEARKRADAIWGQRKMFESRPDIAVDAATWLRLLQQRDNKTMNLLE